jgi:hypothetical protein
MLEPGDLVDDLADYMGADEAPSFRINGAMRVQCCARSFKENYGWALSIDFMTPRTSRSLLVRIGRKLEEPTRWATRHQTGQRWNSHCVSLVWSLG